VLRYWHGFCAPSSCFLPSILLTAISVMVYRLLDLSSNRLLTSRYLPVRIPAMALVPVACFKGFPSPRLPLHPWLSSRCRDSLHRP
jgi:hypothetical protein